jgi:cytochrome c oxidase subunit 1
MSLFRMPLTCWGWFVTAILGLLAFGVLLAGGVLLLLDRSAGTSFFLPAGLVVNDQIQHHSGGSPLLWQHLFWFFGHPEVYIAILPGMGVASHVLSTFARKPVFGYRAMAMAICAIGFLGFMVWGHHMFVSGMSPYSGFAFSVLTMSIGVPSAIKTFNWLGTLWGGRFNSPRQCFSPSASCRSSFQAASRDCFSRNRQWITCCTQHTTWWRTSIW